MPERRRAQHRKSRRGCLQCKQRHTKCDETRPECVNCTIVGRQCRYAEVHVHAHPSRRGKGRDASLIDVPGQSSPRVLAHVLSIDHPSPASSSSSTNTNTVAGGCQLTATKATGSSSASSQRSQATAQFRVTRPSPPVSHSEEACESKAAKASRDSIVCGNTSHGVGPSPHSLVGASVDQEVNVDHMELLIHFSLTKAAAFTEFEKSNELLELGTNLILQKSMSNTALLHQVLAISARYLSLKRPERHDFYSHQAVQLQTKAIELFNQTKTFDESNCEAMLLFSSLLNRQVLADALSNREGAFSAFLDRFIQAGQLHRGIRAVSRETWPMLLKSDLSPLLQSCDSNPVKRQGQGTECEVLRRLVSLSSTLDPVTKEACRSAIHFLQIGFDDVRKPRPVYAAYNMIYLWFILLPDEFVSLLTQHKPEALAILASYAVLLHIGRNNWVVGDSGAFLVRGISAYLGVDWAHCLAWPLQQLSDTRTS